MGYCVQHNKGRRLKKASSGMQCSIKVTTSEPWWVLNLRAEDYFLKRAIMCNSVPLISESAWWNCSSDFLEGKPKFFPASCHHFEYHGAGSFRRLLGNSSVPWNRSACLDREKKIHHHIPHCFLISKCMVSSILLPTLTAMSSCSTRLPHWNTVVPCYHQDAGSQQLLWR